jgi:hypothetical protein
MNKNLENEQISDSEDENGKEMSFIIFIYVLGNLTFRIH